MTELTELSDEERQILLRLIDVRVLQITGRVAGHDYISLIALRRKLEGTDKRVLIERTT